MLRSVDGPCVLAVDAPWGAGKTTFLRMLSHHLRNQEFPVIEFNAWETDFAGDPFVALSEELTAGLRAYATATQGDGFNPVRLYKLRQVATEVLRRAAPGAIRVATAGILDVSPLLEKEVGQALASYAKQRLSAYLDTRASVRTFRTSLKELATELADANDGLPLIVLIDELDRCRPSYAVELLETAKHLFSVDRVVFVLAVNRSELAHSIRPCTVASSMRSAICAGSSTSTFGLDWGSLKPLDDWSCCHPRSSTTGSGRMAVATADAPPGTSVRRYADSKRKSPCTTRSSAPE